MYATRIGLKAGLLRRLLRTAIATGGRPPSKRECSDDRTRLISVLALRKLQKCAETHEPALEAPASTEDPTLSEPSSSGWAT